MPDGFAPASGASVHRMDRTQIDEAEMMKHVRCNIEELYRSMGTSISGLTEEEASRRIKKFGPNTLPEQRKLRMYKRVLAQFRNLFNVLLIIAAILSFISGFTAKDWTSVNMGFAIMGVVLLSIFFSIFQEQRAERAVEAIRELVPRNAKVQRDGQLKQVSVDDIVSGDVLNLEEGDKVPADARIVCAYEFSVDNSTLTGESDPQKRTAEPGDAKGDLYRSPNLIFAGTTVSSGTATAVVLRTGEKTEFGRIVSMARDIVEPPSPLQVELDGTAKLNFIVAISVGILFLLAALFFLQLTLTASLLFMIGVMVSLVPEGLQVTVTLSLALSSLAMSRRNVIVKRLSSVETLGSCTVICSDKTGTITEGQMTVKQAWIGGRTFRITGEGYEPTGAVFAEGAKVSVADREDLRELCRVAALDNTATLVPPLDRKKARWTAIGDSTDASLLVFAAKSGLQPRQLLGETPRIGMIPFESTRKMMTSIHRGADGSVVAYVKGAGHEILAHSASAYWDGQVVQLDEEMRLQIRSQIDGFSREAYRVLALARRTLPGEMVKYSSDEVERQLTFVGLVAILDPPRHETPDAVHRARSAGIKIVMITGDHELTAEAIAKNVGIITSGDHLVMTGYELAKTNDEDLEKLLRRPELVFARINPEQKLRIVRAFRGMGETVAVTGDGVNDAPALLEADIGVAMGLAGTDVARESADMVILDDNFSSIVNGIEEGRAVFDNLKKFITYIFCHNWAELATFLAFVLLGTPLPLAVIQVLAIDLIMDIPPSLSLTLERPEPGIMDRPPRKRGTRLFGAPSLARSAYIGLLTGAFALFWCFTVWTQGGWSFGTNSIADKTLYLKGTTIVMVGIMAGQFGALFAMRTTVQSAFRLSLSRNKWLLVALAIELSILVALVYVPFLQPTFSTAVLDPLDWLVLFSFAPVILMLEEGRKLVLRRAIMPVRTVPMPVAKPAPAPPLAKPILGAATGAVFTERAPSVVAVVPMMLEDFTPLSIASAIGDSAGSRVIVIRVADKNTEDWMLRRFDILARKATLDSVAPIEYLDIMEGIGRAGAKAWPEKLGKMLAETGAGTLVLSVSKDIVAGKKSALKKIEWLEKFTDRKILLVSQPITVSEARYARSPRILIPVLDKVQKRAFELAEVLTADSIIPNVDVIAARVIEMPRIKPLYSVYRPESLVNMDKELSFLKAFRNKPLFRAIHPKVLLVRDVGRDLVDFALERKVDMIVIDGDWSEKAAGFLTKTERRIAAKASCAIVVIIPKKGGN